jgi:pimeloyl-ACP methyl ester carboxylesterase
VPPPIYKPAWLSDRLAGLIMTSRLGYLATAYTVSRWLTRPSRGKPRRTPTECGLPWERLECRTEEGLRLVGWAITPPRSRATILLCHGLRNNREQTLERTVFLVRAGYRCVAFDHRAHGQSEGHKTSFGYHESHDVLAMLEMIRRRWPHEPIAALGVSMGAAALCFCGERLAGCAALILESMYHDIHSAFFSRLGTGYPAWFRRLSEGLVGVTERRLGLRVSQLAPIDHIGALAPTPVLLLTGAEDDFAGPEEIQRLYDRCRGPRELWLVPGATHGDVCEKGGLAYRQRVLSFLDRWLPKSA